MSYLVTPDRYALALERMLQQFAGSGNWKSLLEALYNRFADSDAIMDDLASMRDLDTATGVWLDILGEIIGIPRPVKDEDPANIFTVRNPAWFNDPNKGVFDGGALTGGYLQSATGLGVPTGDLMEDEPYRDLIRAKAAANNAIGTFVDIYNMILNAFGVDATVTSPGVGQISVTFDGAQRLTDPYFTTGIGDWTDNSLAPSSISYDGGGQRMLLNQVFGGTIIADTEIDVEVGVDYIIYVSHQATASFLQTRIGTTQGGTEYISDTGAINNTTYAYNVRSTSNKLYIRFTTTSTGINYTGRIATCSVKQFVTQAQRSVIVEKAPNVAGTKLTIDSWPVP